MHVLPKRLSRCILNAEAFEPGMEYISVLDESGNRKDYCSQCWKNHENPEEGHFWKGKIPLKKEKIQQPDKKAFEIFRHTTNLKQKFILALYLQRKEQLLRRTQTLYENPQTGELFEVERVTLSPEEGEKLAQELQGMMDASLSL